VNVWGVRANVFGFVTKHACDRQTELIPKTALAKPSIAASCG